jgi:hypothetical protein
MAQMKVFVTTMKGKSKMIDGKQIDEVAVTQMAALDNGKIFQTKVNNIALTVDQVKNEFMPEAFAKEFAPSINNQLPYSHETPKGSVKGSEASLNQKDAKKFKKKYDEDTDDIKDNLEKTKENIKYNIELGTSYHENNNWQASRDYNEVDMGKISPESLEMVIDRIEQEYNLRNNPYATISSIKGALFNPNKLGEGATLALRNFDIKNALDPKSYPNEARMAEVLKEKLRESTKIKFLTLTLPDYPNELNDDIKTDHREYIDSIKKFLKDIPNIEGVDFETEKTRGIKNEMSKNFQKDKKAYKELEKQLKQELHDYSLFRKEIAIQTHISREIKKALETFDDNNGKQRSTIHLDAKYLGSEMEELGRQYAALPEETKKNFFAKIGEIKVVEKSAGHIIPNIAEERLTGEASNRNSTIVGAAKTAGLIEHHVTGDDGYMIKITAPDGIGKAVLRAINTLTMKKLALDAEPPSSYCKATSCNPLSTSRSGSVVVGA